MTPICFPSVVNPQVLLGVFSDDEFHLLVHFVGQTKDFRFLVFVFFGPDGVTDERFIVVTILFSTNGRDHDRPVIHGGENRGSRGGLGFASEKIDGNSLRGALIGQNAERLSLPERFLQEKKGIALGDDHLAPVGALSVDESLEKRIVQGANDDCEGNTRQRRDLGKVFPETDMGCNKYAASRLLVDFLSFANEFVQILSPLSQPFQNVRFRPDETKPENFHTNEEKSFTTSAGNLFDLSFISLAANCMAKILKGDLAPSRHQ